MRVVIIDDKEVKLASFIFDTGILKYRCSRGKRNIIIRKKGKLPQNIQLSLTRKGNIPRNHSFFPRIDRFPNSRLSRSSESFGTLACGRVGCLAPGAATWTVSECNSFEIGFGFPRNCFDLGRITLYPLRKAAHTRPARLWSFTRGKFSP